LVYRAELLPDPRRTAEIWREAVANAGLGEIYLARVESYDSVQRGIRAVDLGFDADIEFAPFSWPLGNVKFHGKFHRFLANVGLLPDALVQNNVIEYDALVSGMLARPESTEVRFKCVTPSWDNTARRKDSAYIFHGSTPEKYGAWLRKAIERTTRKHQGDEKLVFINAWNEWAEGNHLEPDLKWGNAYLAATRTALETAATAVPLGDTSEAPAGVDKPISSIRREYWKIAGFFKRQMGLLSYIGLKRK